MKPALPLALLLLLFSFSPPVFSQDTTQNSAKYMVELIVFARNAKGAGTTENWPEIAQPPDWSKTRRLSDAYDEQGVVQISADSYRLAKAYQRLRASRSGLRPLIHEAWVQSVHSKAKSRPLYIRTQGQGAPSAPQIEGTVLVSSNRYLHLNLDLTLSKPAPPEPAAYAQTSGADSHHLRPHLKLYRMLDRRRMLSGKLYYIDHPLLGVLIEVTPYSSPEPTAAAVEETGSS